jgi:GH15 family glucan-1,4-alpha-glucosidase
MLITRFLTENGVGEVTDFMPLAGQQATDRHRLVRHLKVVRGTMEFVADVKPRFDYGRAEHTLESTGDGFVFSSANGQHLTLHPTGMRELNSGGHDGGVSAERIGDDLRVTASLREGETAGVVLESMGGRPRRISAAELEKMMNDTSRFWRDWVHRSTYRGRWREMVARSAMTLKLMTYAPTGALVAAPTTGLPEQVGGERNWDYRYTWIRDASFSVYALLGLGYTDEAAGFCGWLRNTMEQNAGGDAPLSLMYRVDGSSDLDEEALEHFEGFQGSSPVRIGNGAADQLQLDIYGEAMDSIFLFDRTRAIVADRGWNDIVDMIDWLCDNWDQPDEGIWETRGGRKPFTYSRLMEWVAFDRAIRLAIDHGRPANLARWRDCRDAVYRRIMTKGWNDSLQAFVQHEGSDVLDASLLLMPLVGFVVPTDEKWQSTLRAMDKVLVSDSLVYRYDPNASPDGLRGSEGTFSLCTFLYVDALARSDRLEDARLVFEKMLTYANHVGLFAEEIGITGEQLGNFPQAFTHLALINAALNLDYQLDHGAGKVDVV